jgi:hypothetical protein
VEGKLSLNLRFPCPSRIKNTFSPNMSIDNKQLINSTDRSKALKGAKSGKNHPFSEETGTKNGTFFLANTAKQSQFPLR